MFFLWLFLCRRATCRNRMCWCCGGGGAQYINVDICERCLNKQSKGVIQAMQCWNFFHTQRRWSYQKGHSSLVFSFCSEVVAQMHISSKVQSLLLVALRFHCDSCLGIKLLLVFLGWLGNNTQGFTLFWRCCSLYLLTTVRCSKH